MQGLALGVRDSSPLEGVHLLWYGETAWGYSPSGFTILRRDAKPVKGLLCDRLDGSALEALHRGFIYQTPHALIRWRPADCPRPPTKLHSEDLRRIKTFDRRTLRKPGRVVLDQAHTELSSDVKRREEQAKEEEKRHHTSVSMMRVAVAHPRYSTVTTPGKCRRYRFDLSRPQPYVRLTFGTNAMLVIALRGDKAIRAELVSGPGISRFELHAPGITRLIVYTAGTRFIELCVPDLKKAGPWQDWSKAEVLVKHLQLPNREVNPNVSSFVEEFDLAKSRMLQTPLVTQQEFKRIATYLKLLTATRPYPPFERILIERDQTPTGFQEFSLLPLALLPQVDGDGRRMLGLAYPDHHKLVPEQLYDYRVTGQFPEIDIVDRILSFRLVPRGTVLPRSFYLDDVRVRLPASTAVEYHPVPGLPQGAHVVRRGIRLDQSASPGLRLEFPAPVQELTLEFAPENSATLHVRAIGAGFLGLGSLVSAETVAVQERISLSYDEPIARLEITGNAFFYGLRLHGVTGEDRDPGKLIPVHLDLLGIPFADTPLPPPPSELAAKNLQTYLIPEDPEIASHNPPHSLGFRLRWRQGIEGGTPIWPADEEFAPPVNATAFAIERRRVDQPSGWKSIGVRRAFGARLAQDGIQPLLPDLDLMEHFRTKTRGAPPDDYFSFDDVLNPPGPADGPPPGSLWQYRIATVDLIGRHSATWTLSPVVRLEKRIPPPAPAPPTRTLPPEQVQVLGVEARLIQRGDPDIPDAEKDAVLGATRDNAIVLRWSWPTEFVDQDPYAREFRVYFRSQAGTVLNGQLTSVTLSAVWNCRVDWDRDLGVDALAGLRLRSGGHSFRIEGHDAGRLNVSTRLKRLALNPGAAPIAGAVELIVDTAGAEGRPALFDGRVEVLPITAGRTDYEAVLFDRVTLDEHTPRQTVWAGVSSADDQSYVPDTVPPASPNGGRPGNESQVVTRMVSGRYYGRPTYVIPDPLAIVPERVTDEPQDGHVRVALPLPSLVRAAPGQPPLLGSDRVQLERMALSELSQRLSVEDDGVFHVQLLDGTAGTLTLGNADDRTTLRQMLETGEPARVANRYLLEVLLQHPDLGELFVRLGQPTHFGEVFDTLPGQAERYFYRIRRADAAGHLSEESALLDEVVRVPSLARLGAPDFEIGATQDDLLRVRLFTRGSVELKWLVVFHEAEPLDIALGAQEAADLIRLKNRRDLLPDGGYRLRRRSTNLVPHATEVTPAIIADGVATVDFQQSVGYGQRLQVWAIALSRDGIPSLLAGPRVATTARPPITAPVPSVARNGQRALISWPGVANELEIRLLSDDGTGTWRPVSGWLGPGVTTVDRVIADVAEHFRLEARTVDGRRDIGIAVPVPGA